MLNSNALLFKSSSLLGESGIRRECIITFRWAFYGWIIFTHQVFPMLTFARFCSYVCIRVRSEINQFKILAYCKLFKVFNAWEVVLKFGQ